MLISSPFLSLNNTEVYDEQCINQTMQGGFVGHGAFPVSQHMTWHGGLHLHAPSANEPVRAIADGVVIFSRKNETTTYDNQAYSTGCVVIRHETEIGATGDTPTRVTFYSIALHLSELDADLPAVGKQIYRKAKLGLAGFINGRNSQVHFEIIAGQADVQALVGRTEGRFALNSDGRTDAVYGQSYIFLPQGTPCFASAAAFATPQAAPVGNTSEDFFIGLDCQGDITLNTYRHSGELLGSVRVEGGEYELYDAANKLHHANPQGNSPSGFYELLRFGRNLGSDPLRTDAQHVREVFISVGTQSKKVWVNLNAANTYKFSDADFPHWRSWKLVGDDNNDASSQCQSKIIENFLNKIAGKDSTDEDTPQTRLKLLCSNDRQALLSKTICKFPTEWAADDVHARWDWILNDGNPYLPRPASSDEFKNVIEFAQKLCFWEKLPQVDRDRLTKKHWHFHPREFIIQMRKCGWLSANELAQCFPRKILHLHNTQFVSSELPWATALQRATRWYRVFNFINRKYAIDYPRTRLAHYFSHVVPETGNLSLVKEGDNASQTYLSSKPYFPYYGRGLIQLTWKEAYINYGKYKCFPKTETSGLFAAIGWNPDVLVANTSTNFNAFNCADTAGFYIASHKSMLRKMDHGTSQEDAVAVSRCVNGNVAIQNLNGLDARLQSIIYCKSILLDSTEDNLQLTFEWRRNSSQEVVGYNNNGSEIKRFVIKSPPWTISISALKQRP